MTSAPASPDQEPTTEDILQELQTEAKGLFEKYLSRRVLSHSPHQMTGNSYQSIRFDDKVRGGFRATRTNLFAGFEIEGKSVCDLGANLGEIARDLRRTGAASVDAYEYDPLFTQLARYITAYNKIDSVDHYQADVSVPGFLRREYDITVGLSAFSFIGKNLPHICSRTREQIILETHEVRDASWVNHHVKPISRTHPHWCCFGVASHGERTANKRRLWLTFSKHHLGEFYQRRAAALVPGEEGTTEIDMLQSRWAFADEIDAVLPPGQDPLTETSVARCAELLDGFEREIAAGERVNLSMSGVAYWLALIVGIPELRRDQAVTADNTFFRWMRLGIEAGKIDPGLRPLLSQPGELLKKAEGRLKALETALREKTIRGFRDLPIAFNATPMHDSLKKYHLKTLRLAQTGEDVCVPILDGHHRVFITRLLGIEKAHMMLAWDFSLPLDFSLQGPELNNYQTRMAQYLAGMPVEAPHQGTGS